MIQRAKKPKKAKAPAESVATTPAPAPTAAEAAELERKIKTIAQETEDNLNSQPTVKFMIPLSPGENRGTTDQVCINGVKRVYPKGTIVDMPEQVAEMFAEKYRVQMEAGEKMRLPRAGTGEALE